jgi:hypothetical protein
MGRALHPRQKLVWCIVSYNGSRARVLVSKVQSVSLPKLRGKLCFSPRSVVLGANDGDSSSLTGVQMSVLYGHLKRSLRWAWVLALTSSELEKVGLVLALDAAALG